ncbi:hypothetical protein SAMN02799631_06242 [Methylobacterium sp. 174MFSha1.1]|nr:hypothetical protein [Methylobacterium sp. 174MFSha1.1]SFV15905.1 hypothetical protein SAMN02799631_06242 [Methylobacterium sp. 174MFSha1.1]
MKRDALIRLLRRYAKKEGLDFALDTDAGKGSHYRLRLGGRVTTIQSGELTPHRVKRILDQLDVDPAAL